MKHQRADRIEDTERGNAPGNIPGRDAKAITSPVSWTLLGLLVERPGYRYELSQRFERLYGDVRPLRSESHIYASLKALKTRGLVEEVPRGRESTGVAGGGHQSRLYYRATEKGVRAYQEWLVNQIREDQRHSELLVRQLAVFAREPEVALQMLERYELVLLQQARGGGRAGGREEDAIGELIAALVEDDRRLAGEAKLAWIGAARSKLQAFASAGARADGAT
ncbi:MAG TPA: PadR family transcriptional regulator [Solirubrobacteraceae bacterium]|nr:PadR family transcriptional regulator [Solirubrobacteraceae bacterium]